ncbi:hypothetical protein FRB99_003352, partial [Tulasnella sp. 403]
CASQKAVLCDELLRAGGLDDPIGSSDPILVAEETSPSGIYTANAGAGRFPPKYGERPQRVQPPSSEAEENALMSSLPTGDILPYESIQPEDLCEVCHKRPKFREIKIHPYCGSTCAPKAPGVPGAIPSPVPSPEVSNNNDGNYGSKASGGNQGDGVKRCTLVSCAKPCTGDFCSPTHARLHSYTQKLSKSSSQIPGSSSTIAERDATVLSLADATSSTKVRDLFVNSWQPSSPADVPQVAAVLSVKLAEKYERRFTTAMTQGIGTRATFPTFFGGHSFDGVGFGDTWLKGPHGEGVYTSSTPRMAHRFTVGQANIPFRPMIVCDVIVVEDPTAQGNVIFDDNGQIVCKKKDNILPKFVVIYQPPPEIEIINSGMTGQLALPPPTAPRTGPEADYLSEAPDEFDSGGYPVSDDEFAGLPGHPGGTLPPAYQDLDPFNVPDVNIPTVGHNPHAYHAGSSHKTSWIR